MSYRYVPVMTKGVFDGVEYDGIMTELQGNHLALVPVGRAGSDVVVADHNPFFKEEKPMKMTKIGAALNAALSLSSPILAADSAMPALVAKAHRKTDKNALKAGLLAIDASIDSNQLDAVLDAILDVEPEVKPTEPASEEIVKDESPAEKVKAMLAGKVDEDVISAIVDLIASPAVDEEKVDKEDVKAAMDSLRGELRAAFEAAQEVKSVVGEVNGIDSAAKIYGFALDAMSVDRDGVEGGAALRALFRVASKAKTKQVQVAHDASSVTAMFPGLARITQG
jgi:hypothetical protein